jgi:hypothetical protein
MDAPIRRYRLLASELPVAEKRLLRRYLIPQLAVLLSLVVISSVLGARNSHTTMGMIGFAVFAGLFFTYMAFGSPRRVRKKLAKSWETYVLEIGPDYLLRQQADTPDIRLPFQDVKRIEHLPGRYLRVIGLQKHNVIGIPESIENFPEVLQTVAALAPVTTLRSDRSVKTTIYFAIGVVAYMTMLWSRSPQIVLPVGTVVIGMLLWLFVFMQRSPNVSRRNKRTAWLYLFMVLLCAYKIWITINPVWNR